MTCTHRPRKLDTENGYAHCMWCEETGDCDGGRGYCQSHGIVWAVNEDRRLDAINSTARKLDTATEFVAVPCSGCGGDVQVWAPVAASVEEVYCGECQWSDHEPAR